MTLKYFTAGFLGGIAMLYFYPGHYLDFFWQTNEMESILAQQRSELGKPRVGVQIGHLNQDQVPEELSELNKNSAGLHEARTKEVVLNSAVAKKIEEILEREGIGVDLLPVFVPPGYQAQAFVSLHADWSQDKSIRGFKTAGSAFDNSGLSQKLSEFIEISYGEITGLPRHGYITSGMTRYYAFNHKRFQHSVSPKTPSAIIELGFFTNQEDRGFLQNNPEKAARAVAKGILNFLNYINQNINSNI